LLDVDLRRNAASCGVDENNKRQTKGFEMKYPMLNKLRPIAAMAPAAFGHQAHAVDAAFRAARADSQLAQPKGAG
jgi:hypothetical protein